MASDRQSFSRGRVARSSMSIPELRAALRAIARESKEGVVTPLASVLDTVAGGAAVLQAVRQARDEVNRKQAKARAALQLIGKQFQLNLNSPILQAVLKFAADWEGKKTTKTKELGKWIEYLNYFREAGGVIPMASKEDEDAVRLMTAHGAKGLEFSHVFILRATSGSFPTSYRETLVEFPRELRDPDSAAAGDDKTLNDQEERRLFYVAMTRAKDSLHIYGKQGIGRDKTPAGIMRELIGNHGLQPWLRARPALPSQPELIEIAAAADPAYPEGSRLPAWLELPPIEGLGARLSATAVETYETCPLQFKFEREWKLSRQVHAAMQYGAVMHRVLRTYYDSVRLGRTKTHDELIQLFQDDLAATPHPGRLPARLVFEAGPAAVAGFPGRHALNPSARSSAHRRMVRRADRRHQGCRTNRPHRSHSRRQRCHRGLQDRQGPLAGRCRRESATFDLCHGRPREVGIPRGLARLSQS